MEKREFDLVVVGGGSAGYAAARTGHERGMSVAIIDGAEELGGLCILKGCMPSKGLIESANRLRAMREARRFGLKCDNPRADERAVFARKSELIDDFASYRQEQLASDRFTLIRGYAAFASEDTLTVHPASQADFSQPIAITFRSCVLATGSQVFSLDLPGQDDVRILTSDDILELDNMPDELVVLGGGAIALEMACFYEGMGKQVHVIQRSSHVLTGTDREVAKEFAAAMRDRDGLTLYCDTQLEKFNRTEEGKSAVIFNHEGEKKCVEGDAILMALGRKPDISRLNLALAKITLNNSGHVDCDAGMSTSNPLVYAAGDVAGPYEVVHTAIEQGEIAAHNAAQSLGFTDGRDGDRQTICYRLKLLGIFTDPQIATVGLSEEDAQEQGIDYLAKSYPFNDHGKSMIHGADFGFVKMIAEKPTGKIIGASVIGPEAAELIHELVVAMHFEATVAEFIKIPHYHPTLSEIWTYPAEEILDFL